MKKYRKKLLSIVCIIVVGWLAIFITDFARSSSLKTPIFAFARATADDGGSGTYHGLGYKIEAKKYADAEYGTKTAKVEMYIFGKLIVASVE